MRTSNGSHKPVLNEHRQERSVLGSEPISIVSVGRIEPSALIRDTLPDALEARVSIAADYRELWNFPANQSVHVVLIHNSLCTFELEEAAHLIRFRWPTGKILLIRSGEISLADALYDDRLIPPVNALRLLSSILRLVAASDERNF